MRFLAILLAVLAGCKSAPVQYEMMEVSGVQTMQDLYRSTRKGRARAMPEVPQAFWPGFRSDCDLQVQRRANTAASRAVFSTDRIVPPRGSRKERALAAGIESAVDSIRLPAVD
jgi:hypothetical protein